ncbi:MAG: PAS domain-containing protein, partial [Candidatus Thorarchaeota archaeon]
MVSKPDFFYQAVQQSANMITITDKNGMIEYANPKFEEVSGYTFDEVKGKKTSVLKSDKMPIEIYEDLWGTISKGHIWSGELLNKTKTGEFYWVNISINPIVENGEVTHYVGISEVITEQKLAKEALVEFKEQFKSVLKSNLDGIAILDNNGRLVQGNTALERIFGYSLEELAKVENIPKFLMPEEMHEKFFTGFEMFKRTGKGPSIDTISEWKGLRKDGKILFLELSISS